MIHDNSTASRTTEQATGRTGIFRRRVHAALSGVLPITDRQVAGIVGESDMNNIRPEITRLKRDGLVEEVGKTHCETTGRSVRKSRVTPKPYFERAAT